MKFDSALSTSDFKTIPEIAQAMETLGFDGVWTSEAAHNPYIPLALAAQATTELELGTGISIAFARSPTITAHEAWDLAQLSDGRFMLGLGTQIKTHIVRRFGMEWGSPGPRMRDYILAIKAVWDVWQNPGQALNHQGDFYQLTYMTPFFQPPPLKHERPPLYIAAVGPYMCKLAGELCDGVHIHAFHTIDYLQNVTLPRIEEGLNKAGRTRDSISLNTAIFVATNDVEKIAAKQQLAFYASTPAYRGVLEQHGMGDLQDHLARRAKNGEWQDLHTSISDELLNTVGVIGDSTDIGAMVRERYEGILDRIGFYLPFVPGERDDFWKHTIAAFR